MLRMIIASESWCCLQARQPRATIAASTANPKMNRKPRLTSFFSMNTCTRRFGIKFRRGLLRRQGDFTRTVVEAHDMHDARLGGRRRSLYDLGLGGCGWAQLVR